MGKRLYQKIAELLDCLLAVLFPEPAGCVGCGGNKGIHETYRLCTACRKMLKTYYGNCLDEEMDASYDNAIVAFCYEGIARDMVLGLKYRDKRHIAPTIASLLFDCLDDQKGKYDIIVPVPVSRRKLASRGYNHVRLISDALSRESGIMVLDCLQRIRDTKPQVLFNINERWYNVKGCFKCICKLEDKRVLLVDDILTTGATAHYCAEVMKECGAKSVTVLAFAKSIMK